MIRNRVLGGKGGKESGYSFGRKYLKSKRKKKGAKIVRLPLEKGEKFLKKIWAKGGGKTLMIM